RLPALLVQRAAERVVGVVVRRRELEDGAELGLGLAPAADAEIRDPERLPDRGLPRLEPLRLLERDRRLRRQALLEAPPAFLEEVVCLAHPRINGPARARVPPRPGSRRRRPASALSRLVARRRGA